MTKLIDILIVEDDATIVKLYEAIFSSFTNYSFITTSIGEDVTFFLEEGYKFRLGIIDIKLIGKVSGIDVGVLLHTKCPDMVLFAMTGYSTIFDTFSPSIAGFTSCFSKPVGLKDLFSAVKDVLE